jgi:hypothetical protein
VKGCGLTISSEPVLMDDIHALKSKYSKDNLSQLDTPEYVLTGQSMLKICIQCQGQRTEKIIYNHMVMEQTCPGTLR